MTAATSTKFTRVALTAAFTMGNRCAADDANSSDWCMQTPGYPYTGSSRVCLVRCFFVVTGYSRDSTRDCAFLGDDGVDVALTK